MPIRQDGIYDLECKFPNPLNGQPYSDEYKKLIPFWSSLPVYNEKDNVVKMIQENQVILLVSETGSGKSVVIPRLALFAVKTG